MIRISNTLQAEPMPFPVLARRAQRALGLLGLSRAEFNLLLCGSRRIQTLNRRFRGVDRPTDVLSFPFLEPDAVAPGLKGPIGDIAICIPVARRQARLAGHSVEVEVVILMVHGLLHLVGHDHDRSARHRQRMRQEERRLLEAMGVHATMV